MGRKVWRRGKHFAQKKRRAEVGLPFFRWTLLVYASLGLLAAEADEKSGD